MQTQAEHDQQAPRIPQGGGAPQTLRLWLLGSFRVSVGARSIGEEEWHLRKARSLLKLLALAPEQLLETLMDTLRPRKTLLLIDNCEHFVETVARLVDTFLDSCPNLLVGARRACSPEYLDRCTR